MFAGLLAEKGVDAPATVDPNGDAGSLEQIQDREQIARGHRESRLPIAIGARHVFLHDANLVFP